MGEMGSGCSGYSTACQGLGQSESWGPSTRTPCTLEAAGPSSNPYAQGGEVLPLPITTVSRSVRANRFGNFKADSLPCIVKTQGGGCMQLQHPESRSKAPCCCLP